MYSTSLICNKFTGIKQKDAVFSAKQISASDMQNVELFSTLSNGGVGIRTAKGNISVCGLLSEGENVINIFDTVQKGVHNFIVHTETSEEGRLYLFDVDKTELILKKSGLQVTGISTGCDFASGWVDLFVFSNSEEMFSLELGKLNDEGELDEIIDMPLKDRDDRDIKGLGCVNFDGRLWVFNKNVLWYSVQENIYDFITADLEIVTSAGYIEFVKPITAIYPYLGSLAVFFSDSSVLVVPGENGFSATEESPGGCASDKSLVYHGVKLYYYDNNKKGIFSFDQEMAGNKLIGKNIAEDIQEWLVSIPLSKLRECRLESVITKDRNELWFLFPSLDEKFSDIMIYDCIRESWVRRKSQKIACLATVNEVFYSAGKDIYEEYTGEDFAGGFIESYYQCTHLNLGSDNTVKIFYYPPRMTIDLGYENNFYVKYLRNYDALKTAKTRTIRANSMKNVLYWDISSWDVGFFAPKVLNSIVKLPPSTFNSIEITFFTTKKGEEFCIKTFECSKIKMKQR